jgi:hypothetical protein
MYLSSSDMLLKTSSRDAPTEPAAFGLSHHGDIHGVRFGNDRAPAWSSRRTHMSKTNQQIAHAVAAHPYVLTLVQGVRNEIVRIEPDAVVVRSARTGRARTIPFDHLRRASRITRHGCVVRALAAAIGL